MADAQVTQAGDQANTDQQQQTQQQSLGWRAALPDEYKEHEFVKDTQKPGDFVKRAIEVKTERDTLKTKLEGAIIKPGEKATDEEKTAYRKSLGIPEKPEGYEFEKAEGIEHDPNMISWAQKVFHKFSIPKEAAIGIGKEWDAFLKGVDEEEDKLIQAEIDDNQKKFRGLFKTDDEFKAALELNKRYYKKVMGEDLPSVMDGFKLTRFIHEHAKKYGEDKSLVGTQTRGIGEQKPGMIYDKTPQHQKK
jgi:hypothetical protein